MTTRPRPHKRPRGGNRLISKLPFDVGPWAQARRKPTCERRARRACFSSSRTSTRPPTIPSPVRTPPRLPPFCVRKSVGPVSVNVRAPCCCLRMTSPRRVTSHIDSPRASAQESRARANNEVRREIRVWRDAVQLVVAVGLVAMSWQILQSIVERVAALRNSRWLREEPERSTSRSSSEGQTGRDQPYCGDRASP